MVTGDREAWALGKKLHEILKRLRLIINILQPISFDIL